MATTWTVMNIDAAPQEEVCFSCFRYIVRILTRMKCFMTYET